jgi:hypothetical protein
VNIQKVTESWPSGTLQFTGQPSVTTNVFDQQNHNTAQNGWYVFDVTDIYNPILNDPAMSNHGVRLRGDAGDSSNYHSFSSSEGSAPPVMVFNYDDQPDAPVLNAPANAATLSNLQPTLSIAGDVHDPQASDDVYVRYCWSKTTPVDCASDPDSGWLDNGSNVTIWAGALDEGATYHWKVESADGWMLGVNGYLTTGFSYNTSPTRSFVVTVPHLGEDPQLPMATTALPQGVTASVNEANGNLYLHDPLVTMTTPGGALKVSLDYNSQDDQDSGFGRGWTLAAGPESDPHALPARAVEKDNGDTFQITRRDGSKLSFSKTKTFNSYTIYNGGGLDNTLRMGTDQGAGQGDPANDTLVYGTKSGSRYWFKRQVATCDDTTTNCTWILNQASPATATNTQKVFNYAFDTSGRLKTVTEPLGRTVNMVYNAGSVTITLKDATPATIKVGGVDQVWTATVDNGISVAGETTQITDPHCVS